MTSICRSLGRHMAAVALALALATVLRASGARAELPEPELLAVFPLAGKVGTTVEVTVRGNNLDDLTGLVFDDDAIRAEHKDGNKFAVTIAPAAGLGRHEVRVVGRWGISAPRSFIVSELDELVEGSSVKQADKDAADRPDKAAALPLDSAVSARLDKAADEDYYRFAAKKGQRVIVECQAREIDSKMDPVLEMLTRDGHRLGWSGSSGNREALVDVTLAADGEYEVKVYDATYSGGADHWYRLSVSTLPYIDFVWPLAGVPGTKQAFTLFGRNLPGGQPSDLQIGGRPLERLPQEIEVPGDEAARQRLAASTYVPPAASAVDGFEFRLSTPAGHSNAVLIPFARANLIEEHEPNSAGPSAQKVALPCDISGRFGAPGDVDWYMVEAKKGDVYWIDVLSSRIGSAADPTLVVDQVGGGDPSSPALRELLSVDDDATNVGRNKFPLRSDDPRVRWVAPAGGFYRVEVQDRYRDIRGGPELVYQLRIRKEQPDFRLFVLHASDTAPGATVVGKGGSRHCQLLAYRLDGFDGPITVEARDLPKGVNASPAVIGPGRTDGVLVLTAGENASPGPARIKVVGRATLGGQELLREGRGATLVWATPPNMPRATALARLTRDIVVAVRDADPFAITVEPASATVQPGGKLELKVRASRPDYNGPIQLQLLDPPAVVRAGASSVPADKAEGSVAITVNGNARPGTYTFALLGQANAPFTKDRKAKGKQNTQIVRPSPLVTLIVERSKKPAKKN